MDNLKILRQRRGLSQAALAEVVGVSQGYIADLENGRKANPSLKVMTAIAEALGVQIQKLT